MCIRDRLSKHEGGAVFFCHQQADAVARQRRHDENKRGQVHRQNVMNGFPTSPSSALMSTTTATTATSTRATLLKGSGSPINPINHHSSHAIKPATTIHK